VSGGRGSAAAIRRLPLEAVRDIRIQTRLTFTGLDLAVTSIAAFVGGWIFGYLVTVG
jgi:hypothetical protein